MAFLSEKLISASGGATEETDDDFNLVTSLYHFDGSNGAQNNTFLDSSSNGLTLTKTGTISQVPFRPFSADEGKWSVYFDGSAAHNPICVGTGLGAAPTDVYAETSDFTLEFFVFTTIRQQTLFDSRSGINSSIGIVLYQNNVGALTWYVGADKITASASAMTAGVWNHVALSRASGTSRMWINGTHIGSFSDPYNYTNLGNYCIGGPVGYLSTYVFQGHISNFRFIKGTAIYSGSSDITVPTSPLTAVTNTKLLCFQSNRYIDNSTVGNTITPLGFPYTYIQPFSPFAPSAGYGSTVKGGSGYFDGSNAQNNLAISSTSDFAFGTGDYTLEAWVYPNTLASSSTQGNYIVDFRSSGNDSYGTGGLYTYIGVDGSDNGVLVPYSGNAVAGIMLNAWNHVAVTRESGTERTFINGVLKGSNSNTSNHSSNAIASIGSRYAQTIGTSHWATVDGFLSNFRVIKGSAAYTSGFSVPTAPVTDVTNTKLLANFTNAAIFDQSGKTNVDTVGNAQLDTSVKKFGTASVEFDHTGDYLQIPTRSFVPIGGGDFTIECFIYHDSTPSGNGQGYFQLSNGYLNSTTRGPAAGAEGNNGKWTMFAGTTQYTHTGLPSTNTWYHVAMVRNSGTTKLYVDGTEYLSASDTTNYTDTYFIIGGWYSTSYLMDGYIDEFRISLKARYTSNFTAPTKEFANR